MIIRKPDDSHRGRPIQLPSQPDTRGGTIPARSIPSLRTKSSERYRGYRLNRDGKWTMTVQCEGRQWNLSRQNRSEPTGLYPRALSETPPDKWTTKPLNSATFLGLGPCMPNGVQYTTFDDGQYQPAPLDAGYPVIGQSYGYVNDRHGRHRNHNGLPSISGERTWNHDQRKLHLVALYRRYVAGDSAEH